MKLADAGTQHATLKSAATTACKRATFHRTCLIYIDRPQHAGTTKQLSKCTLRTCWQDEDVVLCADLLQSKAVNSCCCLQSRQVLAERECHPGLLGGDCCLNTQLLRVNWRSVGSGSSCPWAYQLHSELAINQQSLQVVLDLC
jgi:hypothetical protein